MAKWNKAVKGNVEDILRNRGPIHEKVALDQAVDTAVPSYAFVSGWHFYAYLDIPTSQEECDDADDERVIAQLYHAYTLAAKRVVVVFGDKAELLEHQGSLLHFHLRFDARQANQVLAFGHLLATFVADDVMTRARTNLRFSMAAEYGSCCILRVPSGLNEDSSYSRVSLGPCANNPAKKLLGTNDVGAWKLAYRPNEGAMWQYYDCEANEVSRELIRKAGFGKPATSKNFESVQAFAQDGIDPIEDVPYSTAKRIPGYVFRADLDGFTRKVHEKFSGGDEDGASLMAESFISFMEEVSEWQKLPRCGIKFITCPWAGDCCTMVVGMIDQNDEYAMSEAKSQISTFPTKLISQWESALANRHQTDGLGTWTYSVALGYTRIFTENVEDTPYRLTVGWPSSVSHEGVNIANTNQGDLVMHKDDVAMMTSAAQKSFQSLSPKFRRQDATARQNMTHDSVVAMGQAARSTSYHSYHVPETRPYFPSKKEGV